MWWVVFSILVGASGLLYSRTQAKRQHKTHAALLKAAKLRHEDLLSEFNYDLYRLVKDTPGATEFVDELKSLANEIHILCLHLSVTTKLAHDEKKQLLADWHRFSDNLIGAISPAVNNYPVQNFKSWRMEVAAEGIVLKQKLSNMLES